MLKTCPMIRPRIASTHRTASANLCRHILRTPSCGSPASCLFHRSGRPYRLGTRPRAAEVCVAGLRVHEGEFCLAFLLAGISLIASTQTSGLLSTIVVRTTAVAVMLMGGVTLAEYIFDNDFGIDEPMVVDRDEPHGDSHPGRASPATAANFALLGLALLLLPSSAAWAGNSRRSWRSRRCYVATLALLGYLYGADSLYRITPYSSMALHTAATFALLSIGVLFAVPDSEIVAPARFEV